MLTQLFFKYAEDLKKTGKFSHANEKNIVIMKGLYRLKAEWDLFQDYLDNPKVAILQNQQNKKNEEGNSKKPNFTAMFSDFNPEGDNQKQYPLLETILDKDYGENLESFIFRGEKTDPEGNASAPSWFKGSDAEQNFKDGNEGKKYLDDISKNQLDRISALKNKGKDALDLLQEDEEYMKIFTVLSRDIRGDLSMDDIQTFLREPAASWEEKYFNTDIEPTRKEIESFLKEIEHPQERKNKYAYLIRDLYTIHDTMNGHILTEVDLNKRDKLQKLIAQREFLFYRENVYLKDIERFREMTLRRLDKMMYGLDFPESQEKIYRNMIMRLKYEK